MPSESNRVADLIREALESEPEWGILNSMPPPVSHLGAVDDLPRSYVRFVREVADGFNCGTVMLFDLASVREMQFYTQPAEMSPVRLGADAYFCAGKLDEDPWFIKRDEETVWFFPVTENVWWESPRLERLADDLDDFFLNYACGTRYREVSTHLEDQDWPGVLARIGRAG